MCDWSGLYRLVPSQHGGNLCWTCGQTSHQALLTKIPFGQSRSKFQLSDQISPGPLNLSATLHKYWKLRASGLLLKGLPTIIRNPSGNGLIQSFGEFFSRM